MVAMSDEMEVSSGNQLNIQLEKEGNIEIAGDCQIEFAYRQSLVFEPFKVGRKKGFWFSTDLELFRVYNSFAGKCIQLVNSCQEQTPSKTWSYNDQKEFQACPSFEAASTLLSWWIQNPAFHRYLFNSETYISSFQILTSVVASVRVRQIYFLRVQVRQVPHILCLVMTTQKWIKLEIVESHFTIVCKEKSRELLYQCDFRLSEHVFLELLILWIYI